MAVLKAYVEKLEDIDEGLRSLYGESPTGTGYVLDVDETEYKAKLGEFRTRNIDLDKRRQELEATVKQFEGVDPKKYKQAMEALTKLDAMEEGQLLKEGKLDDVVAKRTGAMKTDYERQLQAKEALIKQKDEEAGAYKTRLGSLLIDASVQAAANKAGMVRPGAMTDLLSRARHTFRIDEQGQMVPRDSQGQTIFGKNGDPISAEEWAANLVTEAPHLFESARGGGSSGGSKGDGKPPLGVVDRNDPTAMGRNLTEIAKGKMKVVG